MKFSPALQSRLIACIQGGIPPRQICQELNISRSAVQKYRRMYAPERKGSAGRPRIGSEAESAIAEMVRAGVTDTTIAAALGICSATVAERRRKLAPEAPRFRGRGPLLKVLALLRAGRRLCGVAAELGISRQAVGRIRRRFLPGLPVRRGRPRKPR